MSGNKTGIELMLQSLLKAAGFDPQELANQVDVQVRAFFDAIKQLQTRLDTIDANQICIARDLADIRKALHIPDQTEVDNVAMLPLPKRMEN